MNKWFTSDMHLGHWNMILPEYCDRPFRDGPHMDESLIKKFNSRVEPNDVVYHIGDFCFKGGREGGRTKAQVWEDKLNGKLIHIVGNHDRNNSVKEIVTKAIMEFGGYEVLVQHRPPTMALEIPEFVDFVICGHVHDMWKHTVLEDLRNERIPIPIINVGVDVWDYRPVSLEEILKYYHQVLQKGEKPVPSLPELPPERKLRSKLG